MPLYRRWRARSRLARSADLALFGTLALLTVALVVNSAADVRQSLRMHLDQKVMHDYLNAYAGGPGPFGHQAYVAVRRRDDLVCAFLRHANGGLCLYVVSRTTKSRKIAGEFVCINRPNRPKHVKHWRLPKPPRGQHWCPWHGKKVV